MTHAVELCSPGAALVVFLEKGRVSSITKGSPATATAATNLDERTDRGEATVEELADEGETAALKTVERERKKDRKKLIEEERKEQGAVSFAVYK